MSRVLRLLAACAVLWLFALPAFAQDRVLCHIDDAEAQATKALRNVRNRLDVAPETKIVVVTHANGVDFLMEGAKDRRHPGIEYAPLVSALQARGLRKDQFAMDADFTPSGVVRMGQLQARERYAYIKP